LRALKDLALRDVENTLRDRPRVIVFKDMASQIDKNVNRAMGRIVSALPSEKTQDAKVAKQILFRQPETASQNLARYYAGLAKEEIEPTMLAGMGQPPGFHTMELSMPPDYESEMLGMAGLSRYFDKIGDWFSRAWDEGYLKVAAGIAAVGALSATGVLDTVWDGVKSAVSFVGGGISKLVTGIFGGSESPETSASADAASGIPDQTQAMTNADNQQAQGALTAADSQALGTLLQKAVEESVVNPAASQQAQADALMILKKLGLSAEETGQLLGQLMNKALATWKPKQPTGGYTPAPTTMGIPTPIGIPGIGGPAPTGEIIPGVPNIALIGGGALLLYIMTQQRG